jgi:hypothetical protein
VHVLSLSTAGDYGKSGICHFSLGKSKNQQTVEPVEPTPTDLHSMKPTQTLQIRRGLLDGPLAGLLVVTMLLKASGDGTRNPMKGAKLRFSGGMAHWTVVSD